MGYGEYGGGGSFQNAVWLSEPDDRVTQLTKGPEAWRRLDETQLSRRARAFIPRIEATDDTFYGRDGTLPEEGFFKVRVRFQHEGEVKEAAAAFQKALDARELEVEYQLAVVKDSPGQLKVAWGRHASEGLGDDIPNGAGGRRGWPGGLLGLWYRLLSLLRLR
jgi:hypothetical protein